jgi:hypothetical protein
MILMMSRRILMPGIVFTACVAIYFIVLAVRGTKGMQN